MEKFLESVSERDFDRRISEVVEMLEEQQLYGTISLIKDLKYHLDLAVKEKTSCNCQHNSNSRDNEPCCKCGRKKTNADRIRNMSGEELAKYIYDVSEHCADCVVCGDDCDSCDGTEDICVPKIVEWLKTESED